MMHAVRSAWTLAQARLGYWERDGKARDPESSRRKHRKWRYTRERLIRSGQLEQFKGTVDVPSRNGEGTEKRTITFIRLLAAQTPESKVRGMPGGCTSPALLLSLCVRHGMHALAMNAVPIPVTAHFSQV